MTEPTQAASLAPSETRCRRCLEWNLGGPWYCPRCGKETTLTPHDGGTMGDSAVWARTHVGIVGEVYREAATAQARPRPEPEHRCPWCGEDVRRDDRGVFGKATNLGCPSSPDGKHGEQAGPSERPSAPTYDDPVCIVCEREIAPDRDATKSAEGYWWHYVCRGGAAEACARLAQAGPSEVPDQ